VLLQNTDNVRSKQCGYTGTSSLSFRAWDESDLNSAGGTVNLTADASTGGISHFSTATAIASTTVTPIDVAPLLSTSTGDSAWAAGEAAVAVDPQVNLSNPSDAA